MRLLIDGYNLMYAQGHMGKKFGPDAFRKVRARFLNDLAGRLGPVEAHLTTVVFDAAAPPDGFPRQTSHKGIAVVFAVDDDSADERIIQLIAEHSAPKQLTVVTSDNRIRQAATRRKARVLTSDQFLVALDRRAHRPSSSPPAAEPERREQTLSAEDAAFWLREFGSIEEEPEFRAGLSRTLGMPTDAEIAAIEREVEREFGEGT